MNCRKRTRHYLVKAMKHTHQFPLKNIIIVIFNIYNERPPTEGGKIHTHYAPFNAKKAQKSQKN